MCIFVSGIVMLVLQSMGIVSTFVSEKTGFSMYRKTNTQMEIPTIVICQTHKFDQFSPKNNDESKIDDWFFNQFYWLNERMHIKIPIGDLGDISLTIGNNTVNLPMLSQNDPNGNLIIVEELMNPWMGLCYAITSKLRFEKKDFGGLKISFLQKVENPTISLVSPEDRYGFLFPDMGHLIPLKFSAELGEAILVVDVVKTVWNYLSDADKSIWGSLSSLSENSCKHYYKSGGEDSYMKCQLKAQNDCYQNNAPKYGCNCVLNNTFKVYFELYPTGYV